MLKDEIHIYTDGASKGNPGPAGIGIFFKYKDKTKEIAEYLGHTTNNVAELTAIKKAFLTLKKKDIPVKIYTDSSYSIGVLAKNWKAKENLNLINEIKKILAEFKNYQFIKVKGHSDVEGNIIADQLANDAIKLVG